MAELVEIKRTERADHTDQQPADPHQVIATVSGRSNGGTDWKLTHQRAIEGIESGRWQFFVRHGSKTVDVVIATYEGQKYLKSTVDEIWPESLLALAVIASNSPDASPWGNQ